MNNNNLNLFLKNFGQGAVIAIFLPFIMFAGILLLIVWAAAGAGAAIIFGIGLSAIAFGAFKILKKLQKKNKK